MLYKSFSRLSRCKTAQVRTPGDSKVVSLRTDRCVTCVGPDVRRLISAINTGLNFNRSVFFFCSKAFSRTIFSLLFRAPNHQIVGKKNKTEFASQTFIPEIKFRTNPGLTLNNPAQTCSCAWVCVYLCVSSVATYDQSKQR